MFRKTSQKQQMGIFSSPNSLLSDRSERFYEEIGSWHNLFRTQVTLRVEESLFEPLYSKENGSPNASVRIMVAMMILKEASRWSDSQLFEHCRFNLLVRRALGLVNLDDPIPTESTYYLFRKRIVDHEKQGNPNLLEETFNAVTKGQAKEFQVSGRSIRMDSKLLGSNIAWLSRYELVHETLRLFCSKTGIAKLESRLSPAEIETVRSLLSEEGNKVVYRCSGDEVRMRLIDLGVLAYRLVKVFEGSSEAHYATVSRLFEEQFDVSDEKAVIPKPKESIAADSIQSPHDTDSHYRNKDGNQVKGYSINVTESCDKEGLNLIGNVEVKKADAADNGFLEKGVTGAGEVFCDPVEKVHADGAYHSPSNQGFVAKKNAELILNAIQGPKGRYDLEMDGNGLLTVKDFKTDITVAALKMKDGKKWRIKTEEHYRYFSDKEISACLLRKKIADIPQEILNIRNNVEATIFQLGYHYTNDKTRYRGIIKHRMWANIRCLWVNFVRIMKHVLKNGLLAVFEIEIASFQSIGSIKNRFIVKIKEVKLRFINESFLFPKTQIFVNS
ncbi:transposase [Aquiflexum sp. TKW24L]|uniref:transposase n=1 Tax=Aquiflexum sp. TKW24L TaxID=2942212 RepID=UPI0020BE3296|nr:transposase [Aquiflexum sp. TKW24L]MCL6261742.1 transposase [Aquiflexum sp. TKW24L]